MYKSHRRFTAEMTGSESTIGEDPPQLGAISPLVSHSSSVEIEDMEQLSQLPHPVESQSRQESLSMCSILSQLSLKDLRMIQIETQLVVLKDGMEKMPNHSQCYKHLKQHYPDGWIPN